MNSISLISVAELLDGRYFFIPAYQRGYRWGKAQMWELLDDLYEFAIRAKKDGEFYCLQPVIVKPIEEEKKLSEIKAITGWGDDVTPGRTWEVVDGQQRLTSLYILYRYLIDAGIFSKNLSKKISDSLYHLCYETRPETKEFLEDLSSTTLRRDNIDLSYITGAFNAVSDWLKTRGAEIAARAGKRTDEDDILNMLGEILRNTRDNVSEQAGSAQFIWYELNSESGKNPIDEFININNGKIRLTDAELIKGLFLQKRNFNSDCNGEQMKIAMQWESIENTLHQNDFWNFLSSKDETDNRIELLFTLQYQQDNNGEIPKDGNLFRYYYGILTAKTGEDIEQHVIAEWNSVLRLFSVLEGWYEDPILYNTIGFLIHSGVNLHEIVVINKSIVGNADKTEFNNKLRDLISRQLPKKEDIEKGEISYTYNSTKKETIRSLLLFLNIYMLNCQMVELRKKSRTLMTPAYKFPFDLYVSQNWDVEHIDSATQNTLNDVADKAAMIKVSMDYLDLNDDVEINEALSNAKPNYTKAWELILQRGGGIGGDDQKKNDIGNLTLLDAETNRSYHNDIFARKRKYIQKVMQEGTFVPLCTQMVFNKGFENQNTDLRNWSDRDKDLYTNFMLGQLKKFYNIVEAKTGQQTLEDIEEN
jgi:hypothetical protein